MPDPGLLLPPGAVLLHVGPYKTGTTALQASFEQHRAELREHGVLYPGTQRRHARPVFALLGHALPGQPDVPEHEWDDLVDDVRRAAEARVVLSSEDFATLAPDQAARAVDDLGADRVHVLMVARDLSTLLPSAWQERVKSVNETSGYDAFLTGVLAERPDTPSAEVFWRHHSLATLIRLWTDVLPAGRVTVVVADDSDRAQLRRVCEQLLGLPDRLLTEGPAGNASLSWTAPSSTAPSTARRPAAAGTSGATDAWSIAVSSPGSRRPSPPARSRPSRPCRPGPPPGGRAERGAGPRARRLRGPGGGRRDPAAGAGAGRRRGRARGPRLGLDRGRGPGSRGAGRRPPAGAEQDDASHRSATLTGCRSDPLTTPTCCCRRERSWSTSDPSRPVRPRCRWLCTRAAARSSSSASTTPARRTGTYARSRR